MSFPKHYITDNIPSNQILQAPKQIVTLTYQQNGLVSVLDQLTSFFEYSHAVFSDLLKSIDSSNQKITELSGRIYNATLNMPSIEFKFESNTGEGDYIHTSMVSFKQENGEKHSMFAKNSNNPSITKRYETCFQPPPLAQLDPYRDPGDGKSCLKMYTNPSFFIETWIQQQKEEYEKKKERIAKRKQQRKEQKELSERNKKVEVKEMKLRREKYTNDGISSGSTNNNITSNTSSTPFTPLEQPKTNIQPTNTSSFPPPPNNTQFNTPTPQFNTPTPPPPQFNTPTPQFNTQTPPPPPPFGQTPQFNTPPPPPFGQTPQFDTPPPPPQFNTQTPPPPPQFNQTPQFDTPPPPPFNPPPQNNVNSPPPPPTTGLGLALQEVSSHSTNTGGGGISLLDQIRKGVNLKKNEEKVEQPKFEIVEDTSGFNTDLIGRVLQARREQLEDSDLDDDDDSASWD